MGGTQPHLWAPITGRHPHLLEPVRFLGHAKVTTTLSVYAHLFEDDHTDAMSALAAMSAPGTSENVVRLRCYLTFIN